MKIILTIEEVKEILVQHIKNDFGIDTKCDSSNFYRAIEFKEVEVVDDKEDHS